MTYTVHVQPSGYTFTVNDDESVLTAALRQGYQFPYACQQAICGACRGQLIEGQVHYDVPVYAITDAEREMGYAVFCVAKPLSDLVIYIEGVTARDAYPLRRIDCPVEHIEELPGHVSRLILSQPREPFNYQAGQYIEILHMDASPTPFSIANAPNPNTLELHIRHLPHNTYAKTLMRTLQKEKKIRFKGPYGTMTYKPKPAYPLLLVAGGTGFAPFKAIIEEALRYPDGAPVYLYWGARNREGLYWHDSLEALIKQSARLHYIPVLSQPEERDQWTGEKGLVHEVILKKHKSFSCLHVYASGPPEMVYATQKAFLEKGLSKQYFYSDLLDYAVK